MIPFTSYSLSIVMFFFLLEKTMLDILAQNRSGWTKGSQTLYYRYETLTFDCVRFPEARAIKRKIIYHAGPTNSGKTHSALERFHASDSGVYCGPLRLLATEVFRRTNEAVS